MKIKQYIVEEINFSCCWKILQGQKLKSLFLIVLELRFSFRAPSSVAIDSSFFMKLTNCFFELIPSLISNRYWMFWQWFYLFYLFSSISYLSSSIDFRTGVKNEFVFELFFISFILLNAFGACKDSLDIGEWGVDFWMFEFVMLVEWAFRAIGLSTGLDSAFVEPFDLMGISPKPFSLLVSFKGAVALLILKLV